jgi:hypothetical protein
MQFKQWLFLNENNINTIITALVNDNNDHLALAALADVLEEEGDIVAADLVRRAIGVHFEEITNGILASLVFPRGQGATNIEDRNALVKVTQLLGKAYLNKNNT